MSNPLSNPDALRNSEIFPEDYDGGLIEDEFDRANERAILNIVQDVLLDFAAFLSITPSEIMQEIRNRLERLKTG